MPDVRAGVFETLLVQYGAAVNADAHVERLARSVRELYDVSLDAADVGRQLLELAAGSGAMLRVRATFRPDVAEVELTSVELRERPTGAWSLVPCTLPGGLGRHKWVDRGVLDAFAGAPWTAETDPLLVDDGGQVLETGRGNVFLVVGDCVLTPRDDGRILPGVVRAEVLELLQRRDIEASEVDVSLADLVASDDVFVTNSIGGLRPVAVCQGVGEWQAGELAELLRTDLEAAWEPRG